MKLYRAIAALFLYLAILAIVYLLHVKFFKVNVVFYSAIGDGIIAAVLLVGLLFWLRWFQIYSVFEKVQMGIICLLLGYIFAISIPTVIDRSLSFYILEKIQQRGGGIRQDGFSEVFTKEYMVEHRLVDVRLTEQLESGTITIRNGCVKLTERGRRLATLSRFYRQNLLPKQRLLMGKYRDDLTDPFRNSTDVQDYQCQ